jgi:Novel toxin 15
MIGAVPQSIAGFSAAANLAATRPNTPVAEICELCAARFRVEAHYDDPWKTPITLAPLRVEYTDGAVVSDGGRTRALATFGLQDGQPIQSVRPELGAYNDRAPRSGVIAARLVPQPVGDPVALERQIIADRDAFARTMETAMQPWITQWETRGWRGLFESLATSITTGFNSWMEDEGDFWSSLTTWASNLPNQIGEAWDSLSASAKALWNNRAQILALLQNLAEGSVAAFETGLAAIASALQNIPGLEDIAVLLKDLVTQSAEWAGAMIELATQTKVLSAIGFALLGTIMLVPPNFWTDMIGLGVGYLIPELFIAVVLAIIAFFTAGTGGALLAARIATYTARVSTALDRAGRAGPVLVRIFTLMRTISSKMIDLIKASKSRIDEAAEGVTNEITRITRRLRRHDVPCFDLPRGANAAEFDRQLAEQAATINQMTVDDMADAHSVLGQARTEHARQVAAELRSPTSSFTDLLPDGSAQVAARDAYEEDLRRQGLGRAAIRERMSAVNATHYLDIVAGGNPSRVGIRGGAENQGIGRQWPQSGRAAGLGTEAGIQRRQGYGNRRMNVRLERCR